MTTQLEQPEALLIADALETQAMTPPTLQAAAELRRLHALNQELLEALKYLRAIMPADLWASDARRIADAAIAKAEEVKK